MRGPSSLFSRFVLRDHNCSKLFQSWSWNQEKKETPFTKAIEKFKVQALPKRIKQLVKPLLKNSFSTHFQGTGPWEGPVHYLVGLFSGFTIAASFSRDDPGFIFPCLFPFLFLSLSVPLPLPLPLPFLLPLPLPFLLPLPLPLPLSLSLFLFRFLFLFLLLHFE